MSWISENCQEHYETLWNTLWLWPAGTGNQTWLARKSAFGSMIFPAINLHFVGIFHFHVWFPVASIPKMVLKSPFPGHGRPLKRNFCSGYRPILSPYLRTSQVDTGGHWFWDSPRHWKLRRPAWLLERLYPPTSGPPGVPNSEANPINHPRPPFLWVGLQLSPNARFIAGFTTIIIPKSNGWNCLVPHGFIAWNCRTPLGWSFKDYPHSKHLDLPYWTLRKPRWRSAGFPPNGESSKPVGYYHWFARIYYRSFVQKYQFENTCRYGWLVQ